MSEQQILTTREQLNLETAMVRWQEVERLFASGLLLVVAQEEDLVETACLLAEDRAEEVAARMADERLAKLPDERAAKWQASNAELWAVVVRPWVLMQEPRPDSNISASDKAPDA